MVVKIHTFSKKEASLIKAQNSRFGITFIFICSGTAHQCLRMENEHVSMLCGKAQTSSHLDPAALLGSLSPNLLCTAANFLSSSLDHL